MFAPGRARAKFAILALAAFAAAVALGHPALLGIDYLFVPGITSKILIGWWFVPLGWLAIVGAAHAVTLTDGLDGLAGHTAAVAFAAYGTIAFLQGQVYLVTGDAYGSCKDCGGLRPLRRFLEVKGTPCVYLRCRTCRARRARERYHADPQERAQQILRARRNHVKRRQRNATGSGDLTVAVAG